LREWGGPPLPDAARTEFILFGGEQTIQDRYHIRSKALIRAKWETAEALNTAIKAYRKYQKPIRTCSKAINRLISQSEEAVTRYQKVLSIQPPAERTFEAVQKWFTPPNSTISSREPPFVDSSILNSLFADPGPGHKFPYHTEAMTLHAPGDEDLFSRKLSKWGLLGSIFRVSHWYRYMIVRHC